jgi:hypothetical protein
MGRITKYIKIYLGFVVQAFSKASPLFANSYCSNVCVGAGQMMSATPLSLFTFSFTEARSDIVFPDQSHLPYVFKSLGAHLAFLHQGSSNLIYEG